MLKKIVPAVFAGILCLVLCACGGLYDKEYYSETDYVQTVQAENVDSVVVKNMTELKKVITDIITDGREEGAVSFDHGYEGDANEDLSNACWQIRTQNAFCAYCVESLSFELYKVMSSTEANIFVTYSQSREAIDGIVRMNYSYGVDRCILQALKNGDKSLTVLINNSSYTEESMSALVLDVYRKNPLSVPREPAVETVLYSGAGSQRLYGITLDYGVSDKEMEKFREETAALEPMADVDTAGMPPVQKAYEACRYLTENAAFAEKSKKNSAYAALYGGEADSEGLALAYVELCARLGVPCTVVYGQKNWEDHCWNIITLGSDSFHVDITLCINDGISAGFLKNDKNMWDSYRWDMSSYASCTGRADFVIPASERTASTEDAEESEGNEE